MEITRATDALRSTIKTVEADVADILESGNYYCTEEIARELNFIKNNLDHLKLDGTLLASNEWQGFFDPRRTGVSLAGATSVLDKAAARLFDYKCQLGAVPTGQKQENEVREMHQWAMTTLQAIQKDLEPFSYNAADRIRQFGDHVGVTDRYTGYRNNLTRGTNEPNKMETSWMDKGCKTAYMNSVSQSSNLSEQLARARPQLEKNYWGSMHPDNIGSLGKQIRFSNDRAPMTVYRGYRTIDSLYPHSNTFTPPGIRPGGGPNYSQHIDNLHYMNNLNATLASYPGEINQEITAETRSPRTMSVQEQAGINTTFPGESEYMQQYTEPNETSRINDFLINPIPNMQVQGRAQGKARYDPTSTEYQLRYEWPDGEKIVKLPWMRK